MRKCCHLFLLILQISDSAMAGADAVISSIKDGKIPLCHDGMPLEPLDYLSLLFPNNGSVGSTKNNACFMQKRFEIPVIRKLFSDNSTEYFVPDDFIDCIACFIILSSLTTLGMVVCKYIWERCDPKFASISPSHKKWYVVANISKALFLATLTCSHRFWSAAFQLYFYDEFLPLEVKRCGVIYITTDAVALYMVPRLPRSTLIHHITTIILVGIVCAIDLDIKGWRNLIGVSKMGVLYVIFSTASYSVNAYLALRVVYPKAVLLKWLSTVSLWTYLLCCACNWTIHMIWALNLITSLQISVFSLVYLALLSTIIHDDIVLIKWLIKKSSPMASESKGND